MADENNAPFDTYSETDAPLTEGSPEIAREELEATIESVQVVEVEGGEAPVETSDAESAAAGEPAPADGQDEAEPAAEAGTAEPAEPSEPVAEAEPAEPSEPAAEAVPD